MEAKKITKSSEYKLVVANGKRLNSVNFNIQYLNSKASSVRFGITASKKLGNAIKRNFAKRRIRSLFYKILLKNNVLIKDYVIICKKGILFEKFDNLYQELVLILKKIDK